MWLRWPGDWTADIAEWRPESNGSPSRMEAQVEWKRWTQRNLQTRPSPQCHWTMPNAARPRARGYGRESTSALHRAGSQPADDLPLEEEHQHEQRRGGRNHGGNREHHVALDLRGT